MEQWVISSEVPKSVYIKATKFLYMGIWYVLNDYRKGIYKRDLIESNRVEYIPSGVETGGSIIKTLYRS